MSLCIRMLQKGNTITLFFPSEEESWQDIFKSQSHDTLGLIGAAEYSRTVVPKLLAPKTYFMENNFSTDKVKGWFGVTQEQYIYCTLYLCYYYISSSSDHQAWAPKA